MNDADFLLSVLEKGPATTNEILDESRRLRGCGLTVHSRADDLRKRGIPVECSRVGRVNGRNLYEYRLNTSLPELAEIDDRPSREARVRSVVSTGSGNDGALPRLEANELGPYASSSGSGSPHSAAEPGGDDELRDPSASSPPPQLALELPGSVYRKDVAA